ncbi:malonate decarboxylase holo-ACP synthase [Geobacillus subterraneus]|uniref:malonate decarboxylase holo-ACP synthase n=1 Tax=Geobacillus subterraneus TaxID=129338 RepID=UPI0016216976
MELNPHDLIRIKDCADFISSVQMPEWARRSLIQAPYTVVRRAAIVRGSIPIGIRGQHRHERFATFLSDRMIAEVISPEQLVRQKKWKQTPRYDQLTILKVLDDLDQLFQLYHFVWGPVGSVGFELASGVPTVKDMSDLDIILRLIDFPALETVKQLVMQLIRIPVRVDVQLELPIGSISLLEYLSEGDRILLKSIHGPKLIAHPCNALSGGFLT